MLCMCLLSNLIMKIEELIKQLENGLDRAESEEWLAFAINADDEAEDLLTELKHLLEENLRMREEIVNVQMSKLTLNKLITKLPLLNEKVLEQRCGLRPKKIYDWKNGRSTPKQDELDAIQKELQKLSA